MSLLKYQDNSDITQGNGRGPVSFARAHVDGLPFRGSAPLLRENEYQEACETVYDVHVDILDISVPEQKARLQEILDRAANQWYRVLRQICKWTKTDDNKDTVKVYIEWAELHREVNRMRAPPAAL